MAKNEARRSGYCPAALLFSASAIFFMVPLWVGSRRCVYTLLVVAGVLCPNAFPISYMGIPKEFAIVAKPVQGNVGQLMILDKLTEQIRNIVGAEWAAILMAEDIPQVLVFRSKGFLVLLLTFPLPL